MCFAENSKINYNTFNGRLRTCTGEAVSGVSRTTRASEVADNVVAVGVDIASSIVCQAFVNV